MILEPDRIVANEWNVICAPLASIYIYIYIRDRNYAFNEIMIFYLSEIEAENAPFMCRQDYQISDILHVPGITAQNQVVHRQLHGHLLFKKITLII